MAEYLKIPEVAQRLDVSEKTARRYVKAGELPSVFIGGAYRVSEEDLDEYLKKSRVGSGGGPGKAQAPQPRDLAFAERGLFRQEATPPATSEELDWVKLVEWLEATMKNPQPLPEQSDEVIALFTEAAERAARGEPAVAVGFVEDESPERNAMAEALARMLTEAEKRRHAEKSGTK